MWINGTKTWQRACGEYLFSSLNVFIFSSSYCSVSDFRFSNILFISICISRNIESTIRLFADDCAIYRNIINKEDIEKLQKDLDRLGEWAVENAMKINPSKSKAVRFTRARVIR